jgi:hypothetical protein
VQLGAAEVSWKLSARRLYSGSIVIELARDVPRDVHTVRRTIFDAIDARVD